MWEAAQVSGPSVLVCRTRLWMDAQGFLPAVQNNLRFKEIKDGGWIPPIYVHRTILMLQSNTYTALPSVSCFPTRASSVHS